MVPVDGDPFTGVPELPPPDASASAVPDGPPVVTQPGGMPAPAGYAPPQGPGVLEVPALGAAFEPRWGAAGSELAPWTPKATWIDRVDEGTIACWGCVHAWVAWKYLGTQNLKPDGTAFMGRDAWCMYPARFAGGAPLSLEGRYVTRCSRRRAYSPWALVVRALRSAVDRLAYALLRPFGVTAERMEVAVRAIAAREEDTRALEEERRLAPLLEPHRGGWVALDAERTAVLVAAPTLEALRERLKAEPPSGPYHVGRVPIDKAMFVHG